MPTTWTCEDFSATTTGQNCVVTATTTFDINVNNAGITLQEWLFVACVMLFFVSLITWRYIFNNYKY